MNWKNESGRVSLKERQGGDGDDKKDSGDDTVFYR
jgi:hypothetical protein